MVELNLSCIEDLFGSIHWSLNRLYMYERARIVTEELGPGLEKIGSTSVSLRHFLNYQKKKKLKTLNTLSF